MEFSLRIYKKKKGYHFPSGSFIEVKMFVTSAGILAITAMKREITEKLSASLGTPAGDSPIGPE